MSEKPTREELNAELKEAFLLEANFAIADMFHRNLWAEYIEAVENNKPEFKLSGAHPAEWIICNLVEKVVTYRSGFAIEDSHLYHDRNKLITGAIAGFIEDAQQEDKSDWTATFQHIDLAAS